MLVPNQKFDDRYLLIKKIGRGGFAEVWRATDTLTDTDIALKVLAPESGLSDLVRASYINEFVNTLQLSHQHLLHPLYYGQFGDYVYIVLPLCENGSLDDQLGNKKVFSETEIAKILHQTSEALAYMHSRGVLHNDIKPANILISNSGDYQLTDFGISTRTRHTVLRNSIDRERTKILANSKNISSGKTVAYAATELFGEFPKNSSKSDVFALGVSLFELATGETPWFDQGGLALKNGADIPSLPPERFSNQLNKLIRRCLDINPDQRPNARELADAAKFYLENEYWNTQLSGNQEIKRKHNRKWLVAAIAAIPLLISLFFIANNIMGSNNPSKSLPKQDIVEGKGSNSGNSSVSYDLLAAISSNPRGLIIAKEDEAPPMYWHENEDLKDCLGFECELGKIIAGKMGFDKIDYEIGEYDTLDDFVRNRKAHIIMAGYVPDTEIEGLDWSDSYLEFGLCLIVRKTSPITEPYQLNRKKVVVYEGDSAAREWVEKNISTANISEKADPAEASGVWMKDVETGVIDAAIYDYPFAVSELARYYPGLRIVKVNLNESTYAIGFPANNPEFKKRINQAIAEIREDPRYGDLIRYYLKSNKLKIKEDFQPGDRIHVVKDGETLSLIAQQYFGDLKRWPDIYELNKDRLPNPHLIDIGMKIKIPKQ